MREFVRFVLAVLLLAGCDPFGGLPSSPADPPGEPTAPPERPEDPAERPEDPAERPTTPGERPQDPAERPEEPPQEPTEPAAPPEEPTEPPQEPTEPAAPPEPVDEAPRWAADVAIADMLLLQGSSVALTPAGPAPLAETNVPVVAGREALLRVMLAPGASWTPRPLEIEVEIEQAAGSTVLRLDFTPNGASTEENLASSANFDLPAGLVTPEAEVSVSLFEALASEPGSPLPRAARFPSAGAAPLRAVQNGGVVEVWFVPLLYAPDGSRRAPDTSPAQIELLRSTLERQYPVSDVLVDVLTPVALASPMDAEGGGWTDALYQISNLRDALAVPDDVYLYGLVQPEADYGTYCQRGCVTGLSWVGVNPASAWSRSSLGLGYAGGRSADTFAHEVGHAHGRQHSPCGGPANPDPDFPNGGGRLGAWGWDAVDAELIDPSTHGDLMSYCRPRWVSDYTFAALSERVQQVNASAFVAALPGWPRSFAVLDVPAAEAPALRATLTLDRPPEGKAVGLELLDERGRTIGTVIGTVQVFEHLGAAAILFEEPDAAAIRYDGVTLPL